MGTHNMETDQREHRTQPTTNHTTSTGKPDAPREWTPPDGGYGWVMVLAGFLLWLEYGSISQSGIFLLRVAPDFNVTNSEFNGLNSIQGSLGCMLGIFLGPLIGYTGCRPMVLLGTVLISVSYITSAYVYDFPLLYLTYGILPSLAIGMFYCSSIVAVNEYFTRNSAKANALAISGFNVSTFAWPPLAAWLCDEYGWRTAFIVEGVIHIIIGTICVILLKPPGHRNSFCLPKESPSVSEKEETKSCVDKISSVISISPLKNHIYDIYLVGLLFYLTGHFSTAWYIPVRSELMGIDPQTAAWHTSALGISVTIMTLLFSPIGDLKRTNKGLMFSVGQFLVGCFTLASVTMTTSLQFFIYGAVLGIFQAIYVCVDLAFFVQVCGPGQLTAGTGWSGLLTGAAPLMLHAIVGKLLDDTGDPNSAFYLAGVSQTLCACVMAIVTWRQHVEKTRTKDYTLEQNNHKQSDSYVISVIHVSDTTAF